MNRPGTWLWLLRHELRLAWRGLADTPQKARANLVALALVLLMAHGIAWLLLSQLPAVEPTDQLRVSGYLALQMLLLVACVFATASAVSGSYREMYGGGPVDLLLASPIAPRSIFGCRAVVLMLRSVAVFAALLIPVANVGAVTGRPGLLGIYPMLLAIGLGATALGTGTTLALVAWAGPRRGRRLLLYFNVAMFVGLLLAAALWTAYLSPWMDRLALQVQQRVDLTVFMSPDAWLWFPARATLGWLPGALVAVAVSLVVFLAVVASASRRYVDGVLDARHADAAPARFDSDAGLARDGRPLWRLVLAKEWLLARRSPDLFFQALFQSAALAILLAFFLRGNSDVSLAVQARALIVPAAVIFFAALTARITWLMVAAEEAPGLLASSPVGPGRLKRQKMAAALILVVPWVAPLCVWLAFASGGEALWCLLAVGAASTAAAATNVWAGTGAARKDIVRRGKSMGAIAQIVEAATIAAWAAAAYAVPRGLGWGALALVAAFAAPLACWRRGLTRARAYGY